MSSLLDSEREYEMIRDPRLELMMQSWEDATGRRRKFRIIEDMKFQREKLISNRNHARIQIGNIKRNEKVNDAVLKWLTDADKLIEEVGIWVNPYEKDEVREKLLKKLEMLNIECKFELFSSPIPGLEYFSSDLVCFKTTKETSDELLDALKDTSSHIIGLHGTSGSGKTALAKAVGEKAKYLNLFDAVLFVTVSQNSIVEIRDQLTESLNLRRDKSTEIGRARKIFSKLESMGPILVILDDVRGKLELDDISIPCNHSKCKVLLTTRCKKVCRMNCQREIHLPPLSGKEAWSLLKKYSSIDNESSSKLLEVARNVVLECDRLPRTIKDIGSSLKNKPLEEWEALLYCLKNSNGRYQVFLNFKGGDTRYSFTGNLYHALRQEGFKTFMDDRLERGKPISELFSAIKASRLSIVVLSENYASSPWCLDELVSILECMKKEKHNVLPIFYKIDPADVRPKKNNTYGKAMIKHSKTSDSERVERWSSALDEISRLSGERYEANGGYEYEFIHHIVEKVKSMNNRLYIQTSTETVNDEHGVKMLNPNDSITRKIPCCGETLMLMMSACLNNPRHTIWRCSNWKVNENSIEQQLEDQKEKILELERKLDAARRKGTLMLCVVFSCILIFIWFVWVVC